MLLAVIYVTVKCSVTVLSAFINLSLVLADTQTEKVKEKTDIEKSK